ncbi:MAG: hypothetical protein WDZ51_00100 [Pirellulaceae bacterium]
MKSLNLIAIACLVSLLGCFSDSGQPLHPVSGTVTRGGQPVEHVVVQFQPSTGRPSFGRTDVDGRYTLHYTHQFSGALIGDHQVGLRVPSVAPDEISDFANLDPEQQDVALKMEMVPVSSRLEVVEGNNTFDFELDNLP